MSRIPGQTLDSAPEQTRATLEKLARRSGKLLNIRAQVASSPVVLAAYAGLTEAVAKQGDLFTNSLNHYARTGLAVPPATPLNIA